MKSILLLLLCLTLVAFPVAAGASPAPFGPTTPLTDEEMSDVEGEFKHIGIAAIAGSLFSTASYMITTPRSSWNVRDAARHAISGAITGAGAFLLR